MKACPIPPGLASEFSSKIGRQESEIITNELNKYMLTLLVRNVSGLVKMAFGLVDAGYSLSEWQPVKLTFLAPYSPYNHKRKILKLRDNSYNFTGVQASGVLMIYTCVWLLKD